jgi:hypothetical protein
MEGLSYEEFLQGIDRRAHLFNMKVIAHYCYFVHRPILLPFMPDKLCEFCGIDLLGGDAGLSAGNGTLMLRRAVTNQIDGGLYPPSEIGCFAMTETTDSK